MAGVSTGVSCVCHYDRYCGVPPSLYLHCKVHSVAESQGKGKFLHRYLQVSFVQVLTPERIPLPTHDQSNTSSQDPHKIVSKTVVHLREPLLESHS